MGTTDIVLWVIIAMNLLAIAVQTWSLRISHRLQREMSAAHVAREAKARAHDVEAIFADLQKRFLSMHGTVTKTTTTDETRHAVTKTFKPGGS